MNVEDMNVEENSLIRFLRLIWKKLSTQKTKLEKNFAKANQRQKHKK